MLDRDVIGGIPAVRVELLFSREFMAMLTSGTSSQPGAN